MRVLLQPERIALGEIGHRDRKTAKPALQVLVQHLRLDHVVDELFGRRDVFCPFRDCRAETDDLSRQHLAVIAERQPVGHGVVVFLFLVVDREFGRDRAVEIQHHQLGVEGIVVVGVVPADDPRRDIAFFEWRRQLDQRLDRRLAHLGIVRVELTVRGDKVLAAIGDHEMVKGHDRVEAVAGQLVAIGVDVAHPLRAQLVLHRLEEVEEGIPRVRNIGDFVARLLD